MIDHLGGTLGSFDRLENALADGERWSGFDRALGTQPISARARKRPAKRPEVPVAAGRRTGVR